MQHEDADQADNGVEVDGVVTRAQLAARLKAACRAAGKRGGGNYAYGKRGAGARAYRRAEPNPAELETLDLIVRLREAGLSFPAIAEALDDEGRRPRRAERWSPVVVRRFYHRVAEGST